MDLRKARLAVISNQPPEPKSDGTPTAIWDFAGARGYSTADLAGMLGVPLLPLQDMLSGGEGHSPELLAAAIVWRDDVLASERAEAVTAHIRTFADTPTTRLISEHLNLAKHGGLIITIAGSSGIGKTMTLKHYASIHSQCWYTQYAPDNSNIHAVLAEISDALGFEVGMYRNDRHRRYIVTHLTDVNGLLICDEAQNLTDQGLEEIRSIHDRTGVGIALCGHLDLRDKVARLPQLAGRVAAPLVIPAATPQDADVLFDSWAWMIAGRGFSCAVRPVARKASAGSPRCSEKLPSEPLFRRCLSSTFATLGGSWRASALLPKPRPSRGTFCHDYQSRA